MKFVFGVLVAISMYLLLDILSSSKVDKVITKYVKQKSDKYYSELIKNQKKSKLNIFNNNRSFISKINNLIENSGLSGSLLINPISMILYGVICFFIAYLLAFDIFKIFFLSVIIALPALFLPVGILSFLSNQNSKKTEAVLLNFLLQLKNYTKINNDIIYAFKQVKTKEPLQGHINKFLVEINTGIKFEVAIENLKEKVSFKLLKDIFSSMQYCYLYGGDFSELLDKGYKMIGKVQKEKKNRIQETQSARLVLAILIVLDLIVYFSFVKSNPENYQIMTNGFIGTIILYWNFISIWLLLILMNKVKKLEY